MYVKNCALESINISVWSVCTQYYIYFLKNMGIMIVMTIYIYRYFEPVILIFPLFTLLKKDYGNNFAK